MSEEDEFRLFPRVAARGHSWLFLDVQEVSDVSRRVRPAVLRQRIVARLDREYAQVNEQGVESLAVPMWWQGYLAGLRAARTIVREGDR